MIVEASRYPYASGDLLREPNTYFYTPFEGPSFIESWRHCRREIRSHLPAAGPEPPAGPSHGEPEALPVPTAALDASTLLSSLQRAAARARRASIDGRIEALLRRFEVTKRIFTSYDAGVRERDGARFDVPGLYVAFGELVEYVFARTGDVRFLSALLKVNDTLCTLVDRLDAAEKHRLSRLLDRENVFVSRLAGRRGKRSASLPRPLCSVRPPDDVFLQGVVFLASFTPRAQVYAQALSRAGVHPEHVVLFGDEDGSLPGQFDWCAAAGTPPSSPDGIRLDEPLAATCADAGWTVHQIDDANVNAPSVRSVLSRLEPKLVLIAGYGGQIIRPDVLRIAPFLHAHAGDVPAQRGSTIIYYNILEHASSPVSAILLEPEIDTGPVVGRGVYALPTERDDIDYIYDNAIRADLLVRVLRSYHREGGFARCQEQADEGKYYFVIHPLLKHLAILSLPSTDSPS